MPPYFLRWIIWYQMAFTTLGILGMPWILGWIALSRKHRKMFPHRLGLILPNLDNFRQYAPGKRKPIWIHALSVGEVWSANPLAIQMKQAFPDRPMVFSASTQTGFQLARERLGPTMDAVFPFPYDLGWAVRRMASHIDPCLVILVETDIWPGFLKEMNGRDIPVFWVNVRMSPRSFAVYSRFRSLSASLFGIFSGILVQSREDLHRFRDLGVEEDRLAVTGHFKFDQPVPTDSTMAIFRKQIPAFHPEDPILIAGSTHPGEEEILLSAFPTIRNSVPNLRMVLVPRDPARSWEIRDLARKSGWSVCLFSRLTAPYPDRPDLVIVDRIGLLRSLYASADIAVIGGSLLDYGGHNPLEPAVFAKPILFGPYMRDFQEIAEILVENGGAVRLKDPSELADAVTHLLEHPDLAGETGIRASQAMAAHRGAILRTIDHIRKFL